MVTGVFKLFLLVSMVTGIFYFAYRPSWQWVLEPACPDWKQHYWDQVRLFSLLSSSFCLSLPLSRLLFFLFSLLILSPPLPPSLPPSLLLLFPLLPSPSHFLSLLLFSFSTTLTRTERGLPPEFEFVGLPTVVRKEQGRWTPCSTIMALSRSILSIHLMSLCSPVPTTQARIHV